MDLIDSLLASILVTAISILNETDVGIGTMEPISYIAPIVSPHQLYFPVTNDPLCGQASEDKLWPEEVVEEGQTGYGRFPWQVYIRVQSTAITCGGALISSEHVVTAGNCVAMFIERPEQIGVVLGDYDYDFPDNRAEPFRPLTRGVLKVKLHPDYKFSSKGILNNVALLQLNRKVAYRPNIRPICLPATGMNFTGEKAWVSGWGLVAPSLMDTYLDDVPMDAAEASWSTFWVKPRATDLPMIESKDCQAWHQRNGNANIISGDMICAGNEAGRKGYCHGDRGGPLMFQKNGKWHLVGVLSDWYSCASIPGIYHRVTSATDWIMDIANPSVSYELI